MRGIINNRNKFQYDYILDTIRLTSDNTCELNPMSLGAMQRWREARIGLLTHFSSATTKSDGCSRLNSSYSAATTAGS